MQSKEFDVFTTSKLNYLSNKRKSSQKNTGRNKNIALTLFWVFFFIFYLLGNGIIEHMTLISSKKSFFFSLHLNFSWWNLIIRWSERSTVGLLLLTEFLLTFASVIFRLYNFKVWRHLKEHSNIRK